MNLKNLKAAFIANGGQRVYVKELAENDNSKNQVYLGGNFEVLNILPFTAIKAEAATKTATFKASVMFNWIGEDGNTYPAPGAQLILYPQYPEVRLSGFLKGCKNAPSALMNKRMLGRILFLCVTKAGTILGYVGAPDSEICQEFLASKNLGQNGVFRVIELAENVNSREKLLIELQRIHSLNWIGSKSLNAEGVIVPCTASQCGGFTLEAELGIRHNAKAEPDYLGWEIKNFGVRNFARLNSSVITLFTPPPTGGIYKEQGLSAFIKQYGYNDRSGKSGREDRRNFGGVHKVAIKHRLTNLTMELVGFDSTSGTIKNANGKIALLDSQDNVAASWNFASMLEHWNKKHNQACFVPSMKEESDGKKYKYGSNVILGIGTDFQLFLSEMAKGNIYYDPGVKIENVSTKPKQKERHQFRIKSGNLSNLYTKTETVDVTTV